MNDSRPVLPREQGPAWPGVRLFATTRAGGVSSGVYRSLNLGMHVGDDPAAVAENRRRLRAQLPAEPYWLEQVHGTRVADADREAVPAPADAAVTRVPGRVLAIMTADCLPVVIAAEDGGVLGAAHAGWRGLAAGVLEATVAAMASSAALRAWIGPAIGPAAFEVGDEVRAAFAAVSEPPPGAFVPSGACDGSGAPKWLADLPALAEQRLRAAGVRSVVRSGLCTVAGNDRFYSYRKEGQTGRFATLCWLQP
ncbi:Laccase domain protein YfiH [Pigmentiphaga humi]|uniref:Purine nucleoside phosphorylase n=1 Tax=Pigmentiphaga humi TaxID=2478468 RepID=A0A3P4B3U1_9BURK|nr:peptidoglycan editing factor PgeF [Pigmentiphaga humi]VCU70298.1 Laccase domain protein YfiH [Pigmentiphaga humi]